SRAPRWSGFSDDCSPYELSVALGAKRPEVRVGFEPQAEPASPTSYWRAALHLNALLCETHRASIQAVRKVEDLFSPTDPNTYFAMWHGACFWPGREPGFKIYLNPYARGRGRAPCVLDEALARLGYPRAISSLAANLNADLDQFQALSVDMS